MKRWVVAWLALTLTSCNGGGGFSGGNPPPGSGGPTVPTPAVAIRTETVVSNASFPVSLVFAPDGRLFYTELQTGNVRIVQNPTTANPQLLVTPFVTVPVATTGEQGLLGLALDPSFAQNRFVYIYHTHPNPLRNRVVRFTEANNVGSNETTIVDNLPVNSNHNGGRLAFGADGLLYVTVGDAGDAANAQSAASRAGKLLRFNRDGTIPAGNPTAGNALFALGLRNPFGVAFHPTAGTPYVSDNGPNCDDELNRIVAGGNYGWRPNYPCGDNDPQFRAPIQRFNPPIAPTGMTFYTGSVFPEWATHHLFLTNFVDGTLRRFVVDEAQAGMVLEQQTLINGAFGALLDVKQGPDGNLYVAAETSIIRIVRGP
jgi:glucose/arabinose dehydrogenase